MIFQAKEIAAIVLVTGFMLVPLTAAVWTTSDPVLKEKAGVLPDQPSNTAPPRGNPSPAPAPGN